MQKSFELIAAMRNAATARTLPIIRKNYQVCTVEYVLSGAGFLQLNGAPAISIQANEVYFLPKHSDHNYYPDKENPWDKLFFVVNGELMASIFQAYDLARTPVIRNAGMLKHYFTEFIKLRSSGSSSNMAALLFHRFAIDCRLRFVENILNEWAHMRLSHLYILVATTEEGIYPHRGFVDIDIIHLLWSE